MDSSPIKMVCKIKKGYAKKHPMVDPTTGLVTKWKSGKVYLNEEFFYRDAIEDAPPWAEAVEESDRQLIEKARKARESRDVRAGAVKRRANARAAVGLPPEDMEEPAPALVPATEASPEMTKPAPSNPSTDLESLREQARGLGIQNAGNMNVNTLRKKISQAEVAEPVES